MRRALQLAVWEIVGATLATLGLANGQGSFFLPGSVAAAPFNKPLADVLAIGSIDNIMLGRWLPSGDFALGWAASPTAQDQLVIGEASSAHRRFRSRTACRWCWRGSACWGWL